MSSYQPKSETITYGEYQATKTKEITSQIFKRDDISTILGNISTPEQSLSNNINFSKILPVKVLPPINEESFNSNQIETSNININTISDTNLDLNTFETNIAEPNTDFDINTLQPSPTLESIQTSETENITFGNEFNSSEATQDFNIISTDDLSATQTLTEQNNDIVQTFDENNLQITDLNTFNVPETTVDTNIITTDTNVDLNTFESTTNEMPQTFDESTFQTTEITPTIQETTNLDINTYSTSEPIIDTTTTNDNFDINALTSETTTDINTNTNFDINNIQTSEPIIDTIGTTENFDLNTLTTTNEMPQTFDESTFQTTEITPTIDINNVQETTNIDINTITENYDVNTFETTNIDTTTNEMPQTFDESTFQTTEITPTIQETTNLDINTYSTSEPIIDTTTTNDNFDINTLTQTEIPSSFDINAIPETTIQTSETTATENFDITNIAATNVETTNYESAEIPTTTDNYEFGTLDTKAEIPTTTDNYEFGTLDTNIESTNINIDTTTTENFNITNLPPVTDYENTQSYDTNNFQALESTPSFDINALPTTTIDSNPAIEETPSFDINALTTNTNEQTYNSSEIQINEISNVDTISDLRATPTFNIDNIESINTGYETNNIIDSTSALQTTSEFDINAFNSSNNVETNIESNTFDATTFQTNVETTPMTFEANNNIETFDINSLTNNNNINTIDIPTSTVNKVQNYTPEININEYEKNDSINIKTIQDKYKLKETKSIIISKTLSSEINIPHFPEEKKEKMVFSIVTPLKGNIAKGNASKNIAKVTLVPNYGISTYRPFERKKFIKDKNDEINIEKINKSMMAPKEYKISTFNPKTQKYKC